jgi:hypothetical protein
VVDLLDQACLVGALFAQFRKFRGDLPQEIAIFEGWDELAEVYLAGLRRLREQAISEVWPADHSAPTTKQGWVPGRAPAGGS